MGQAGVERRQGGQVSSEQNRNRTCLVHTSESELIRLRIDGWLNFGEETGEAEREEGISASDAWWMVRPLTKIGSIEPEHF